MADEPTQQSTQAPPLTPEEYQFQREKYIEWADTQLARIHERHTLSGQEFDKQIVALAGGGLALTLTLAKDVFDKGHAHLVWFAYLSWGCFLVALAINLLSHQTAADQYGVMMDRMAILRSASVQRVTPNTSTYNELTEKINALTPKLRRMNAWARLTTLAGIVLFAIFIADNQYYKDGQAPTKPPTDTTNGTRPHKGATGIQLPAQPRDASSAPGVSTSASSLHSTAGYQIESDTMKKANPTSVAPDKITAAKGCITATSEMLNPHMPPVPPPPAPTPPVAEKK